MNDLMKILIAYDGSECADAALDDLKSAGLPKTAEVRVLSLAEVILPPPIDEEVDNTFPMYLPAGVKRAHERAQSKLKQADSMAKQASEKIQLSFPEWHVRFKDLMNLIPG